MKGNNSKIWHQSVIDLGIIGGGGIWIATWENNIKYIPNITIKIIFSITAALSILFGSFSLRKLVEKLERLQSKQVQKEDFYP